MKRIIFTLLYRDGSYMLSRNFRLQRVGGIEWILQNYHIQEVSLGIDELMILDVSSDDGHRPSFREHVAILAEACFVPLTVGGRVTSTDEAESLFEKGADKLLLNSAFVSNTGLVEGLVNTFGSQAIIAGLDVCFAPRAHESARAQWMMTHEELGTRVRSAVALGAGEILVQSVDRDGTGNGLATELVKIVGDIPVPLVMMGGVGRASHVIEGLQLDGVDAVATANLFNFVGDALPETRQSAVEAGIKLPLWTFSGTESLKGVFSQPPDT